MTMIQPTRPRTRTQIADEITDLRAEANRLPMQHQRRIKIEARISDLTDQWLAADA